MGNEFLTLNDLALVFQDFRERAISWRHNFEDNLVRFDVHQKIIAGDGFAGPFVPDGDSPLAD